VKEFINFISMLALPFLMVILLSTIFKKISIKYRIYDHPGELKIHKEPVPYLGGVAVSLSILITALIKNVHACQFFLLAIFFLALGLYDDINSNSPILRFVIESVFSIIAISMKLRIPINIFTSTIFTYLFIMGAINAVNWMDGMDGLLTGISIIVSFGFYIIARQIGHPWVIDFSLTFVGALAGFLVFNFKPARIFLGDAGSYFIGFTFAYLGIELLKFSFSWKLFASVLSIMGIFIVDSTIAVLRRIRLGRNPFYGDRSHIYDQIYKRTGKYILTVFTMYIIAALGVGLGFLVFNLPYPLYWIVWLGGAVLIYLILFILRFVSVTNHNSMEKIK